MKSPKASTTEIFSSIQGEGIFVGAKQVFIRFQRCNLNCVYCDEPRDRAPREHTPLELVSEVKFLELSRGPHHSVSLTGGEPLLYAEFLEVFLKLLKKEGLKNYLETNGTLPRELERVIDLIDIIAMDFKLPSATLERPFWDEHAEFLKIATRKKVFVKAVVTRDTKPEDVKKAVSVIKRVKDDIPFILQPATPVRSGDRTIEKDALLEFLEIGLRHRLETIRVIPQVHKILQVK